VGSTYAAAKRFEEAISTTEKALGLAFQIRDGQSVVVLERQLALFRQGKEILQSPAIFFSSYHSPD
jgi:hypothetical protein